MRAVVLFRSCLRSRAAVVALAAAGLAGCSSEVTRFSDNPYANPYASRRTAAADVTGSVPASPSANRVERQPLPQVAAQPLAPPAPATRSVPYTPPPAQHEVTGSVPHPPQQAWTWDAGTAVVVAPGETLDRLARKYGVPASAIMQANRMTSPAAIKPGQRIVIPRHNSAAAAAQPPHTAAPAPAPSPGANVHNVAPGETLMSISRHYGKSITELAAANHIPPHALLKIGERLVIPGKVAVAKAAPSAPVAAPAPKAAPVAQAPAAPKVASAEPAPSARIATPAAEASADEGATTGSTGGAPSFRWPVRGRVISASGPKPSGQQNDGIDLAVPEGTAIRSAEDGVVAYAGNELKGYGNLILIRHANGYVTAYAHLSELMVKRNDQVRRGQIIAKSGQTGTVTSPQLHFEIRKGSVPVDPLQLLPAGA
jgi:murein DD-endopeptidase MepM/ murein hydrolase activator NlpD